LLKLKISFKEMRKRILPMGCAILFLVFLAAATERSRADSVDWIRPAGNQSPAVWGIRGGIVFSLWPHDVETGWPSSRIRPRGLIRIGYELNGLVYLINFVAVEPVVEGKWEFSEISPSRVDQRWGKLMWAGASQDPGGYSPHAITRGTISHPDPGDPAIEQLSLYIFMERFENGAHPYLRVSMRSDRPEEIGFETFQHAGGAKMERCALTATMGNYARARRLHLKDRVVDARELYEGYQGIGFVEKESYSADELMRNSEGDLIAAIETNETFAELASWPQHPDYFARWSWRYRPYFKVLQYWRKEAGYYDPSLVVRVNGRVKYWSGGSADPAHYVDIPGGVTFENFEFRENFYPGQKFFFGMTRKTLEEIRSGR
jgi:hypothetical protein